MSKLYLIKSDHDRENIGDVIINLDKVLTVRAIKKDDKLGLMIDYTQDDTVRAWFKTEENLRTELKRLIQAMDSDTTLADEIVLFERKGSKEAREKLDQALDQLKSIMQSD